MNMNCKTITERLKRVAAIVDSWKAEDGVPQIERDIALGELRDIYNALLVVSVDDIEPKVEIVDVESEEREIEVEVVIENEAEEEAPASADVASMESFYEALDIDALLGLSDDPKVGEETSVKVDTEELQAIDEPQPELEEESIKEPATEPKVEVTPSVLEQSEELAAEPEPVVQSESEPVAEEPKPVGAGLFDLNDIPVRSKSRRKMISLYSDNPIPQQSVSEPVMSEPKKVEVTPEKEIAMNVEPALAAEPINVVPQQRVGDIFGEVKTLGDQMAKNDAPTTPFNRITELRQAIGINDKFLMIRDLFGGDAARYEATIDTLDEFDDLDECIIYIVENFRWNPDLEATKLLVSLIERKLA